jgi:hypothetical protein
MSLPGLILPLAGAGRQNPVLSPARTPLNEASTMLSLPFSFHLPSTFDATPYPIVRRERSPRAGQCGFEPTVCGFTHSTQYNPFVFWYEALWLPNDTKGISLRRETGKAIDSTLGERGGSSTRPQRGTREFESRTSSRCRFHGPLRRRHRPHQIAWFRLGALCAACAAVIPIYRATHQVMMAKAHAAVAPPARSRDAFPAEVWSLAMTPRSAQAQRITRHQSACATESRRTSHEPFHSRGLQRLHRADQY